MAAKGISVLLQQIIDNIYQNTNNDISGQILQDQLIDLVDSLNQSLYNNLLPYNVGQAVIIDNSGYKTYICVTNTTPGESPITTPAKWVITSSQFFNYTPEDSANKDISGGYVGKTLEKINFWNTARTFISFFTNAATAVRTYTFPDKDGTIAMTDDIASGRLETYATIPTSTSTTTLTAASNFMQYFSIILLIIEQL